MTQLSKRPLALYVFLMFLSAILFPHLAEAAANPSYYSSPGSAIEGAMSKAVPSIYAGARDLFLGLAGIEVSWFFIILVLNRREMDFIVIEALKKAIGLGLFYEFLVVAGEGFTSGNWFYALIHGMAKFGEGVGGTPVGTPSSILSQGINNAASLISAPLRALNKNASWWNIISDTGAAITTLMLTIEVLTPAIFIILAYALMAIRVFMINIEMYFVLSAGILLLGAGGSRWTTQYARNYINYSVSVAIRFFTIYFILGVCNTFVNQQATLLSKLITEIGSGSHVSHMLAQLFGFCADFWAIAILILMAPKFAASLASGQSTAGVGDAIAPAAAVAAAALGAGALAAGGAAGVMGAGKALGSAGGGSVGGGSGVMSVADAAKMGDGAGSGGFGGSVSGGSGPAGGTHPGSGSGNGTGTAPGIAPASLSPEAIKSQLQNFTPNPIGQNKQGAGAPTKPAASPSSPGNAPAASGGDAAQSEQVPAETSAANGDSMIMSKGPDSQPQVTATTARPDGTKTQTVAGGGQATSKQVSSPTSTGAGATDTGASGTGAGTAGGTPASQQAPDLNKTLEKLNATMASMKPQQKTGQEKVLGAAMQAGKGIKDVVIKQALQDHNVQPPSAQGGHLGSE